LLEKLHRIFLYVPDICTFMHNRLGFSGFANLKFFCGLGSEGKSKKKYCICV
jgi:hypothetical protein